MVDEKYYSQFGEDKILAEVFGEKIGFCIEVGANDGVNDSTTKYFEDIGWSCLLIEPNPVLCEMIRASRTSTLIEVAASNKNGDVTLFVAKGADRAHGVSTINSDEGALSKIESYGFTYDEVIVQSKTLNEILGELNVEGEIDFMTIDVEGHELETLQGLTLERWCPTILLIEDNSYYRDETISDYLQPFGYFRFKRTGVNDWYAHKDNKDLVNFYTRIQYRLTALRYVLLSKLKKGLKIIPVVMKIRNFVLGR